MEPDAAVHAILAAASVPGLTTATRTAPPFDGNLILGPPLAPEDGAGPTLRAVFALGTGGPMFDRFLGTDTAHRVETVQLTIRSDGYDYAGGLALARAVRAAVDGAASEGYYSIAVREPQPTYLGEDERRCHLWSLNVECRRVG